MDPIRGSSPSKGSASADPEQLLNAFKAAALSVTKLYKTSAAAQAKSRSEGYQDCLEDLLAFLDRRSIGLSDGEGWQIRRWATEHLEGRESVISEDDADKADAASSPELPRANPHSDIPPTRNESAPPTTHSSVPEHTMEEPQTFTVPTSENFNFQSCVPYPQQQESYLNIADLDLSDPVRSSDGPVQSSIRPRRDKRRQRNSTTASHLGKGAGQKRTINLAELFDVGNLAFGKDPFGREGKRSRHT
ncbi:hypothetical protein F5Y16DRAFT_359285 [Xylariaceae sp. FL0255]|nr:hypothetical protein F5Y16DRAFT_359285 [Xylariaceae sp. FL0255]